MAGFVHKDLVEDLLQECTRMHTFDHPNILKLSGLCLDGGPAPYVIMPFMANGSLLSYLKEERKNLVLDPEGTDSETVVRFYTAGSLYESRIFRWLIWLFC